MNEEIIDPVYFLLVDDLEENLTALEALLRRDGLIMLKARSGAEALEILLEYEIALALVDIQMPGMDGFELAEYMRGTDRTKTVPIIFLTAGNTDKQRRFRGYEAGAVDFLQKPIDPDILRIKADVFFKLCHKRQKLARQRDALEAAKEENEKLLKETRQYAEALKEADRRKDEFLATLAHELRNPLAPIRNGLQILRMNPSAEKAGQVRDMMDRQLSHMVRLIDDLLDVSRVSEGKIVLQREVLSLSSAIDAALEASRPQIEGANHKFMLHMPAEQVRVNADMTRLAQILSNLLNNAAKYTPPGGHIDLYVHKEDSQAIITIKDNGIGIPAGMLGSIFDLFTQVDAALEQAKGGLGIGLALVKRLVELHEGTVGVQSAGAGKGSAFTVRLPLAEAVTPVEKDTEEFVIGGSSMRILVVDDNVASAQTIGWMLEMIGHETTLVHSGTDALAIAAQLRPDIIFLDIGLPGMNGYDVCRALRSDPALEGTVIVAQTGWGQKRDRELAQEAGFNHHLVKPVSLDDLQRILTQV